MANEYDIKMDKLRRDAQKGEPVASEGKSPRQGGSRKRMGSAAPEINLHGIPQGQGVQGGDDADEILQALGRLIDPAGPYVDATIEKMVQNPNRYRDMASRILEAANSSRVLDIIDAPTQAITRALRPEGASAESLSPVSPALKQGMNLPKGTQGDIYRMVQEARGEHYPKPSAADPLKAVAMTQPRSTERKS